ncbi:MAG TPA: FlgO family outer membrane protein [Pyrinomonadaceae bacterium]|nr:FlgO family outer membrane protein [Pyrinomonadaceae bacterium]
MNKELPPGSTLSHYRIISKIGAGGMGEVYLAQDTKLDRKVAIKFLNEEFSKDADKLNRFVQEAKAASALNHPNILTVYEIGEVDGKNYIATELIDGQTLREHLSQKDSLQLNAILKIGVQVSEALSAAHQAGIIHRDIKPENIMLRKDGYAKVLDFGLAKLSEKGAIATGSEDATRAQVNTTPGMVMGTVSYMSPEQARGKETDVRTDIWSVGVVLYEMLSGKVPFTGETINHTIVSILEKEPPPLTNVPAELQRIVRKSMTKDVDMRYQSARDLLIDLKNLRRELDIQGELERSIFPNRAATKESASENQTQVYLSGAVAATRSRQAAVTQGVTTSSSSLEYAVTQAKSHKLATAIIVVLLVGAISTVSYFAFVSRGGSTKQINSIAVMPFVNESRNADVEYLSDGMTETLIKSLSNLSSLDVKPRSAVFRYKGKDTDLQTIAKELNVQAILNGRVAQRGEQLTLSLELVDVRKNSVIWTEQYQRKQSDLVSLQSEIARDVSTNLKAKLSGAEETKVTKTATADPEAYQAYLKGRYYWNRRTAENLKKAIEQFKSATDRDPNYALAFVGLADCYAVLNEYAGTPTSETIPQSKVYAERALTIDGQLAEAHATLGIVNEYSWQWGEAEKEFKRAIELNPNYPTAYHWYSIFLKNVGRNDEATAMIKRAQELDPLSSIIGVNVSRMYGLQNNHDASIENSLKVIELDPNFAPAYEYLALSYLKRGRNAEAIAAAEKAVDLNNRAGITLGDLGNVYATVGKRAEAIDKIKELEEKYTRKEAIGQYIAAVYVGLGDKDKAFEWLEKDFQARNGKLAEIRWQLQFEPLRDDPRFKDLLKRMGLPQ